MSDDAHHNRHRAIELLRRVVAANLAERFKLMQICPRDAAANYPAFENLVEFGYIERVVEAVGVWHYRLTPAAHAVHAGEPLLFGEGYLTTDREYQPATRGT